MYLFFPLSSFTFSHTELIVMHQHAKLNSQYVKTYLARSHTLIWISVSLLLHDIKAILCLPRFFIQRRWYFCPPCSISQCGAKKKKKKAVLWLLGYRGTRSISEELSHSTALSINKLKSSLFVYLFSHDSINVPVQPSWLIFKGSPWAGVIQASKDS